MASAEQLLCDLRRTPPPRGGGAPSAIMDRMQEWKGMGESVLKGLVDCFSDVESREENLRLVSESLETRLMDLKEKETELKWLQEGKRAALKLRDEELRLREEKLDKQLKLVDEHIDKLEASQGEVDSLRMKEHERLKEIDKRERELEKRLGEFEKREKEFDGKLRELTLKEEVLGKEKAEFVEEVRLTNEKIMEKQKLGYGLIERLELAVNMLSEMKVIMDGRFKEIESREVKAHESLTARLNEAELIQESLEKRFKDIEGFEKELNLSQEDKIKKLESKEGQLGAVGTNEVELRGEKSTECQKLGLRVLENEPEEKKQEVELKQVNLVSCKKEYDYDEQDFREKSLSCVRESAQTCAKENLALSKLDQPQQQSVGTDAGLVADNGQGVCRPREVDLNGKLHDVHSKEQGSKQPMLTDNTDAHLTTNRDESVRSKHAPQMDLLLLLINGPEKDLELGDKMYNILSLSSDPAKLVVEAVEWFNELRSKIHDTERKATILLFDQLTKLSPKIQHCVTEAAIKLAIRWKLKINTSAENPMEALGFLHLLAAYNISSHFDKNELFGFLKLAAKHKHMPDLCRTLGLMEKVPDYIQELINEKQYLLASTYIYEYQLQHMFPQAAILNYYATHSKLSANAKFRSDNSSAAQEKAIATEIAALHLAIEHIVKYGLESDYSPNALTARIKQLEASQDGLRRGIPSPSPNMQKQWRCNGTPHLSKNLSKRARRKLRLEAKKSAAVAQNPQMAPCNGSTNWSSPFRGPPPQHKSSQPKTFPAAPPYPWAPVNLAPMPHPVRPHKRPRMNTWTNKGGVHQGQFGNQF